MSGVEVLPFRHCEVEVHFIVKFAFGTRAKHQSAKTKQKIGDPHRGN
jgi:hypothetical protein